VTWTVLPAGVDSACGNCGARIVGGYPIALTSQRRARCQACARELGFELNVEELDLERFRLEQERQARPTPAPSTVPLRMPAPRPMLPFAVLGELPFDPKEAAVGRDD
jgi:hypothetical protein